MCSPVTRPGERRGCGRSSGAGVGQHLGAADEAVRSRHDLGLSDASAEPEERLRRAGQQRRRRMGSVEEHRDDERERKRPGGTQGAPADKGAVDQPLAVRDPVP